MCFLRQMTNPGGYAMPNFLQAVQQSNPAAAMTPPGPPGPMYGPQMMPPQMQPPSRVNLDYLVRQMGGIRG